MIQAKVDVAALAKLARLEVAGEELAKLGKEIPAILDFVKTVQSVSVKAGNAAPGLYNVLREDDPKSGGPHESGTHTEKLLSAAPSRDGDRIAVKQVLKRK